MLSSRGTTFIYEDNTALISSGRAQTHLFALPFARLRERPANSTLAQMNEQFPLAASGSFSR